MALNKIIFNINKAGIGTPLPDKDHVSGLLSFENIFPSGMSSLDPIKIVYSVQDAIDLGFSDSNTTKALYYHIKRFFSLNNQFLSSTASSKIYISAGAWSGNREVELGFYFKPLP